MRIGIVGGVERTESAYAQIAAGTGHTVVFHGGHLGGRGSEVLRTLVEHVDLVIVVTDVNSHGAVQVARKTARRHGVPVILLRRLSPSRLATVLAELDQRGAHAGQAA